ncbi:MAG: SH3 domain-containing protein [Gemmatimonadota bacterium]|nr:SH3 domain-containing protein [Gemmatimonadota bacterium]
MIRCPGCGQHVLDIASSCPKCHRVLIQNPLETHDWGSLQACGRCGKHIARDAALCPYCGHRVQAARLARRIAFSVGALVVTIAAVIGLWRSGMVAAARDALRRPAPVAAPTPALEPAPAVLDSQVALETPQEPEARPIVAAIPGNAVADTTAPPLRPTVSPVRPAPRSNPVNLVVRWTVEWANVRSGRSVESPIVRVLPPGSAVEVRAMSQGWWEVYADGDFTGYIANSVLTPNPPEF